MSEANTDSTHCCPWDELERLAGRRLDRRRKYEIFEGEVCEIGYWVGPCSGCHETMDGHPFPGQTYDKNGVALGAGCSECGYTGKRRHYEAIPLWAADAGREAEKDNAESSDA